MGRPLQVIDQIINGRKAITARTARELEAALGTSAETWMNLETGYRLYIAKRPTQKSPFEPSRVCTGDPQGHDVLRQLSLFRLLI